ncbi:MAG: ROK family transcriptional regulator [Humibacter sp.]
MQTVRSSTVRDLRTRNRSRTLWELYLHGPLTYQELASASGVSLATVSNVVGDLLRTGAVVEVGSEGSNGGRPRGLFNIRADHGYVVGVDVGETAVMVELFDLGMRALASHRSLTRRMRLDPAEVVDRVIEGIEAVVAEAGIDESNVLGVGVGVPGLVEQGPHEPDGGAVVYDQSIGWGVVPIERMLRDRTSLPITVDNGANTLGQAERWFGAAREQDNTIIVLLGAGVGASILSSPRRGSGAIAAELGHTKVVAGGRECVCGAKGCLEAYAGADALVCRYDQLRRRTDAGNPREVEERMAAILSADDDAATRVIDELVEYLGVGLGNLVNLFTPDRIVIGGWLGHALPDAVLPRVRDAVGLNALARPFERLEVVRAQLGTDAVALGAATLPVAAFLASGGVR